MVWIGIKLLVEFISTKDEQQHYKIFFSLHLKVSVTGLCT